MNSLFATSVSSRRLMVLAGGIAAALTVVPAAHAVIIPLDLQGRSGAGLLPSNENPNTASGTGSGGEVGAGITFDTDTNVLTINVGWGSGNGFTNLTGNAIAGHIHGATPSSGPAAFTQNVGVLIGLDNLAGWNPSATNGGFSGSVTLTALQATQLLEGRFYLNFHTNANTGGEIRGNIVPTPAASALLGLAGLAATRRRRA